MKYQIKNWDAYFENDRSRQREKCSFVCVPNKQHGLGFCRIMAEPDGAAIYGVWCLLLGACSQQKKRNGWLTADGESAGSPWGVEDLAVKFRRPVSEIKRALDFISSDRVGWIQSFPLRHSHSDNLRVTAESPPSHPERNETNGNEGKGKNGIEANITGDGLHMPLQAQGQEAIRLNSLCKEVLGEEEMTRQHKRWTDRALKQPAKLSSVLAEIRVMVLEGKVKTTPARAAEDLWKRF